MTKAEREREIARLEKEMRQAARMMEFEYAAVLRDQIIQLRGGKWRDACLAPKTNATKNQKSGEKVLD